MGEWPPEMEGVVSSPSFWRGRRVCITGHTGFKGSWLSAMLLQHGARVTGFALDPPTQPALFDLARLGRDMNDVRGDVREGAAVARVMRETRPEVLFHMAAQPLVRAGYADPVLTYATNVMGTVNVLEAARQSPDLQAVVVVTTDKCYENAEAGASFSEG